MQRLFSLTYVRDRLSHQGAFRFPRTLIFHVLLMGRTQNILYFTRDLRVRFPGFCFFVKLAGFGIEKL